MKTIPRKAYYLATKAGRNSDCTFDFSAKSIRQSVERSLTRFGIEQIDLLQLHDVEFGDIEMILNKSLPSLALLQAEGKIRYIGITGYSLKVLKYFPPIFLQLKQKYINGIILPEKYWKEAL